MLPVDGRPFAEYLVRNLKRQGIKKIIFSTGHYANQVVDFFGDGSNYGVHISCIEEPKPLGTGGALKFLAKHLDAEFLVINGDSLFDVHYIELSNLLSKLPEALVAMALRYNLYSSRYGQVICNDILVTDFSEKGVKNSPTLINGGVYAMKKKVLELLPKDSSSLEKDLFPKIVLNSQLLGQKFDGYFIDIGVPNDFKRIQSELPKWIKKHHIL
jgi:NDP-sugar pyrophosphorylase family protein